MWQNKIFYLSGIFKLFSTVITRQLRYYKMRYLFDCETIAM